MKMINAKWQDLNGRKHKRSLTRTKRSGISPERKVGSRLGDAMSDQGGKMTYFRVETKAGWTHLKAKNLREAKTEALILRARSLATTGSRYCLLTKHKDDSKPGFVGTQIGEWKMSNVKASGWTAIYISAVTDKS